MSGKEMKDLDLKSETSSNLLKASKITDGHKKTKSGSSALKPKIPKPTAKDWLILCILVTISFKLYKLNLNEAKQYLFLTS